MIRRAAVLRPEKLKSSDSLVSSERGKRKRLASPPLAAPRNVCTETETVPSMSSMTRATVDTILSGGTDVWICTMSRPGRCANG